MFKRLLMLVGMGVLAVGALAIVAPAARAQEGNTHIEVGALADYYRLSTTKTSFLGAGARLGVGVFPHIKLEGEMSYDFSRTYTEGFNDTTTGTLSFQQSNIRVLHGLFGPKFELGHSRIRPFVVVKGGFTNFSFSALPPTVDRTFSAIGNLRSNNVNATFYPGGGIEGFVGPVGLRLEAGDEIYFNNGAQHNLRVTFGPYIRF